MSESPVSGISGKAILSSETFEGNSDDLFTIKDELNNNWYKSIKALDECSPDKSFSNDLTEVSVVNQACKIGLCKRRGT